MHAMMAAPSPSDLSTKWLTLLRPLGISDDRANVVFADLVARYGEPQRHYHTLEHIGQVLAALDPELPKLTAPVAVMLAAWFHDAIYDPRAPDNEEQSAIHARQVLRSFGVAASLEERVGQLILLTKTHQAGADTDGQLLLDADLSVLGAEEPEYDRYAAAIRQEYGWVPEAAYRSGRSAILRGFLKRDRIYRTTAFADRCEAAARNNLGREIARLESV
jgi:predicted metal-dependent HD superfamily phosphohydrolase